MGICMNNSCTISTNQPNTTKAVLNVRDASAYLTICERKLRELIALREIRQCRIGRRIVIRRVDLDNYLEEQRV